ncbi:hypothetical protein ASC82_15000 [Streptomyces sp. Root431]|uniref:agmatine deiminase family protein n=1 Tax=Streptomyces sp. Root431 TaxID=1736535 RepID=UPI0006FE9029|nr:agmatine deiminase family protein [Streptomyces sp. Root431]KQX12502.1 hypothetical protein ASC82_15000 [Streptomyces sp. Root431]
MSDLPPSRRSALRVLAGFGALALGASACGTGDSERAAGPSTTGQSAPKDEDRRMPAEWESHARTFMSWPALASVWEDDLPFVRKDIARIARAISEYEPVVMMARPDQRAAAQKACGSEVVVLLDRAFPGTPPDSWSRSSDQALSVLSEATDARGRPFEIIDLPQPDPDLITGYSDAFLSTYANFSIGNDAVYMPKFGDQKADARARGILQEQFPERDIVQLGIDTIATGGGGIHCATHEQPGKPVA